jgi:formimidoylglutamate deiminase
MSCKNREHFFGIGDAFDAVVFNGESSLLARQREFLLPSIVYTADSSTILGTIVNGNWIVKNQFHPHEKNIRANLRNAMKTLTP